MHFHCCQPHCTSTIDVFGSVASCSEVRCLDTKNISVMREVAPTSCVCCRSLSNILEENRYEKCIGKTLNVFQKCKKLEMLTICIYKNHGTN